MIEKRIEVVQHGKRKRVFTGQESRYMRLRWAYDTLVSNDDVAEVVLKDGRRIRKVVT